MSVQQIEKFLTGFAKEIISNSKVRSALETEAVKSVMRNFETGGRPDKWKQSKKSKKNAGTKTLVISGSMSQIQSQTEITSNGLRVTLMPGPNAKAYARIQHEGGTINMPARTLRFKKSKKTGRDVFASRLHKRISKETVTKPYKIIITARPYLVIPDEDFPRIINAVTAAINLK